MKGVTKIDWDPRVVVLCTGQIGLVDDTLDTEDNTETATGSNLRRPHR